MVNPKHVMRGPKTFKSGGAVEDLEEEEAEEQDWTEEDLQDDDLMMEIEDL